MNHDDETKPSLQEAVWIQWMASHFSQPIQSSWQTLAAWHK